MAALALAICSLKASEDFRFVNAGASCFDVLGFLLGVLSGGMAPFHDATSADWSPSGAFLFMAGSEGFLKRPFADALVLRDFPAAFLEVCRRGVFAAGRLSGLGLRPSGRKGGSLDADASEVRGGLRDCGVFVKRDSVVFSGVPSMVDSADLKVAVDGSYSPLEADRLDDLDCGLPEPSEL